MENYPKRGQRSEHGRYYTHTDGKVYKASLDDCRECDLASVHGHDFCGFDCQNGWELVEGAYILTDEVKEACVKMREMIQTCQENGRDCVDCGKFQRRKDCPARLYLEKYNQEDAWTK